MKALKEDIQIEPALQKAIDEALLEQKSGAFISLEATSTWLRSWGTTKEVSPPVADIYKKFT